LIGSFEVIEHLTREIFQSQGALNMRLHAYTSFLYIRAMRSQAKAVSDALFEIAEGQQGYFTAKQP
jgi:hypothetical protein